MQKIVSVEGKGVSKSSELAEALTGKAQIVTVTLETFPYVIAKLGGGPNGAAMGPGGKIYVTNNGITAGSGEVLKLPIVLVCENNGYGEYTPFEAVAPASPESPRDRQGMHRRARRRGVRDGGDGRQAPRGARPQADRDDHVEQPVTAQLL